MNLRCQSLVENYDNFQGWQDSSQLSSSNLLHRLNTNLNNYECKYKRYVDFQQTKIKNLKRLQPLLPYLQRNQDNTKTKPFPKCQIEQIPKSLNLTTKKVFVSQQKSLKDSDIFCQRTNILLKQKTLCFQKNPKHQSYLNRRKLSSLDHKYPEIQKILIQTKKQQMQQKQNLKQSIKKVQPLTKYTEDFRKLRYRLKKAANKSRFYHEQRFQQVKEKQNKECLFFSNKTKRLRQSKTKQIQQSKQKQKQIDQQKECKINEQFSDQRFYQFNTKKTFILHR